MITNPQQDLLTDDFLKESLVKRSTLIPTWMKVFSWIFIVLGAIAPLCLVAMLLGFKSGLSLYGLESTSATSVTGICLIVLFLVKGITAFGLLKERDWAIKLGLADAITGMAICVGIMVYQAVYFSSVSFRLELIALIPYLLKLTATKNPWETLRISAAV